MTKYTILRQVGRQWKKGDKVEFDDAHALYWHSLGVILLTEEQKVKYFAESQIDETPVEEPTDAPEPGFQPVRDYSESLKNLQEDLISRFVTKDDLDHLLTKFQNNLIKQLQVGHPLPPAD